MKPEETVRGFLRRRRAEIWKRWKAGESLHEIGRAFDKPHTTIRQFVVTSRRDSLPQFAAALV